MVIWLTSDVLSYLGLSEEYVSDVAGVGCRRRHTVRPPTLKSGRCTMSLAERILRCHCNRVSSLPNSESDPESSVYMEFKLKVAFATLNRTNVHNSETGVNNESVSNAYI